MRAGSLDRYIQIESVSTSIDEAGTLTKTFTSKGTRRAAFMSEVTTSTVGESGAVTRLVVTLRLRFERSLVTFDDRVTIGDDVFEVVGAKILDRCRVIEIECLKVGP